MTLTLFDPNKVSAIAASVSAIVAFIALVVVCVQVFILIKQISKDFEWKRREKALLYSQFYHPEVTRALLDLSKKLGRPLHLDERKKPISLKELEPLIERDGTIHDDIRTVLLYLESMGLAVKHNVADFGMLYDINGTAVIHVCELFSEYIKKDRARNSRTWKGVDDLKDRVVQERARLLANPEG